MYIIIYIINEKSETMFFWEIIKEKNWLNKSQCYT